MSDIRTLNAADEGVLRTIYEEYRFRKAQYPDGKNPRFKGMSEAARAQIEKTLAELEKNDPDKDKGEQDKYLMPALMRGDVCGFFDVDEELKGFAVVSTLPGQGKTVLADFYIQQSYQDEDLYRVFLENLIAKVKGMKSSVLYFQPGVESEKALRVMEGLGFVNVDKKPGFLAGLLGKKRNDLFKDPYDRFAYRY